MFKRVYPTKDTFVTNYRTYGISRTGSNAGASEIMYLFKVNTSPQSGSLANGLMKFDYTQVPAPASGNYEYRLHLSDAQHDQTVPHGYTVVLRPLEQDWNEGPGHDLDTFLDLGVANWLSATNGSPWTTPGAYPSGSLSSTFYFDSGHEDLDCVVTELIPSSSYGLFLGMHPDHLADDNDYYLKMFHTRNTHFPSKKPYLELRWEDWTGSLVGFSGTVDPTGTIVSKVYDLRNDYYSTEVVTLHVYSRTKDWNPSIVTTASSDVSGTILTQAYYRVMDDRTDEVVVPFGTGTVQYTRLSYDSTGNYFTLDMSSLPTGTIFRLELIYKSGSNWIMLPGNDELKFRVR